MYNNININTEKMIEKVASITIIGKKYQSKVEEIYKKVLEMGNYWQGQEYDMLKAKFEQNKLFLDELGVFITKEIPNDINNVIINYSNAQNEIAEII